MRPIAYATLLAAVITIPWWVSAQDEDKAQGTPAPERTEVRVWTQDSERELTFAIGSEGKVTLEVTEQADGKSEEKEYAADNWGQFREKYPEVVRDYSLGRYVVGGGLGAEEVLKILRDADLCPISGPWLGLTVARVDDALASQLGLAEGQGLLVTNVKAGGLAETIGVREDDVIVSLDGQSVGSVRDFRSQIRLAIPKGFTLEVLRGGEKLQLQSAAQSTG